MVVFEVASRPGESLLVLSQAPSFPTPPFFTFFARGLYARAFLSYRTVQKQIRLRQRTGRRLRSARHQGLGLENVLEGVEEVLKTTDSILARLSKEWLA